MADVTVRQDEPVCGVLNVYKDKGYTSFHVVAVLRQFTGERKIGHTGTLDPDATGVLPVCIGKATKLVALLDDTDKTYRAKMQLGISTETQDISGEVVRAMSSDDVRAAVSEEAIRAALEHFTGEIEQIPPMYSAVKVGGVKLIDAARKGRVIERKPRKVSIWEISHVEYDPENITAGFEVRCSKGTYIRTLCEDIGNFLGVPACLESLERTMAAGLKIEDSLSLTQIEELAERAELESAMIPVDRMLVHHPYLTIKDSAVKKIIYGNYLNIEDFAGDQKNYCRAGSNASEAGVSNDDPVCRIYDKNGKFYALYRYDKKQHCYKCEKMFS